MVSRSATFVRLCYFRLIGFVFVRGFALLLFRSVLFGLVLAFGFEIYKPKPHASTYHQLGLLTIK